MRTQEAAVELIALMSESDSFARRRQLGFTAVGCLISGYIILQLSANSQR